MFRSEIQNNIVSLQSGKHGAYSNCKIRCNMKKEIWKDVVGYEGFYQISSLGRVKSMERLVVDSIGRKIPIHERMMKIFVDKRSGYPFVSLSKDGGNEKICIHTLIANAFIPNPESLPCVNHIDQDRGNSVLENLEWCTYSYNNTYGEANAKRKESLRKTLTGKHKLIYQFTTDGELVKIYVHGVNRFEEELGFTIQDCLDGRCKTSHGFVFSYNSTFSYKEDLPKRHQKWVYLVNENGEILEKYKSVSEAARNNGFDRHYLSRNDVIDGMVRVNGLIFIVEKKENEYIPKGRKGPRPDLKGKGAKAVCQYTKEGVFVQEFESIMAAATGIGIPQCAPEISSCCHGKLKTARGFIWRHKGEPAPQPFVDTSIRQIEQYTITGEYVATYNSIVEAANALNVKPNSINNNLCGKSHSAFGYKWKYKETK